MNKSHWYLLGVAYFALIVAATLCIAAREALWHNVVNAARCAGGVVRQALARIAQIVTSLATRIGIVALTWSECFGAVRRRGWSRTICAIAVGLVGCAGLATDAVAQQQPSFQLTWKDNSTNETGFEVERAVDAAGPFTRVAQVGANVTQWRDTTVTDVSRLHCYRVRAYLTVAGMTHYSQYSNTACGVHLQRPDDLSITVLAP